MSANSNEIKISGEMIDVGFEILSKSGIVDDPGKADRMVVAQIYLAMHELSLNPRPRDNESSSS